MHSEQWERIQRSVVKPMTGSQQKADDWSYNTRAGYMFRTGVGAVMNRDLLGYGSPQQFAAGLQQAVGTGGMQIRDMTAPGGVDRSFGGGGALTNQLTKQFYTSLQKDFFGNGYNRVGGLNQSETGTLMKALGERGAYRGTIGSLRYANTADRIAQAQEMSDPRIAKAMSGITNEDQLAKAIKKAGDSGDDTLKDSLTRVRDNKQIIDIDPQAKEKFRRTTEATANMLSTLKDLAGSSNINELLKTAEGVMGQSITNEQDAARAKRAIDDVRTFARNSGLDTKSLLADMSIASNGVATALMGMGLGNVSATAVGANIGRHSVIAGNAAAGVSGMNGMTGFNAGQGQAVTAAGMAARFQENPELIAASGFMKIAGDTMSGADRTELQGLINGFGKAGTQEQRQGIQSQINKFIHGKTGKSAMDWMGGWKGANNLLEDADIRENALSTLGANVKSSVMASGTRDTWQKLSKDQRGLLGEGGADLAGMVTASFTESTQAQLQGILNDDPKRSGVKLKQFLDAHAGNLVGADVKSISAADALKKFGDVGGFKDKASGLGAYSRAFSTLGYNKAAESEEQRDSEQAKLITRMMLDGGGIAERTANRGFIGSLADGFLSGPDGVLTNEALVGLAAEGIAKGGIPEYKGSRVGKFKINDKNGAFTDVTPEKLKSLFGEKGVKEMLAQSGGDMDALIKNLQSGEGGATKLMRDKILGPDFMTASLDGKSLTVVNRDAANTAGKLNSAAGRNAAAGRELYSGPENLRADYMKKWFSGEDTGLNALTAMSNNGMLEKIQEGDAGSISKLRNMDKLSGGGLRKSLENAKTSAEQKINNEDLSSGERKDAKYTLEKLQASIAALQNPADAPTMRVGTLHVENMSPNPGNKV